MKKKTSLPYCFGLLFLLFNQLASAGPDDLKNSLREVNSSFPPSMVPNRCPPTKPINSPIDICHPFESDLNPNDAPKEAQHFSPSEIIELLPQNSAGIFEQLKVLTGKLQTANSRLERFEQIKKRSDEINQTIKDSKRKFMIEKKDLGQSPGQDVSKQMVDFIRKAVNPMVTSMIRDENQQEKAIIQKYYQQIDGTATPEHLSQNNLIGPIKNLLQVEDSVQEKKILETKIRELGGKLEMGPADASDFAKGLDINQTRLRLSKFQENIKKNQIDVESAKTVIRDIISKIYAEESRSREVMLQLIPRIKKDNILDIFSIVSQEFSNRIKQSQKKDDDYQRTKEHFLEKENDHPRFSSLVKEELTFADLSQFQKGVEKCNDPLLSENIKSYLKKFGESNIEKLINFVNGPIGLSARLRSKNSKKIFYMDASYIGLPDIDIQFNPDGTALFKQKKSTASIMGGSKAFTVAFEFPTGRAVANAIASEDIDHGRIFNEIAVSNLIEKIPKDDPRRKFFMVHDRVIHIPGVGFNFEGRLGATDLGHYLSAHEKNISLDERKKIAREILEVVDAYHSLKTENRNITHNDLKPSNLMMAPDGKGGLRVKIFDFDTADIYDFDEEREKKAADLKRRPENQTPAYQQPELKDGRYPIEHTEDELNQKRSAGDSWAIGLTLYEVLTGKKMPYSDSQNEKKTDQEIHKSMIEDLKKMEAKEAQIAIELLDYNFKNRPTISEVKKRLESP